MSAGAVRVAAKISSGDSRTAPQPLSLAGPMPRPHVAGGPAPALAADMQSVWLTQFIDATRVLIFMSRACALFKAISKTLPVVAFESLTLAGSVFAIRLFGQVLSPPPGVVM
jgi:hypothetical protein